MMSFQELYRLPLNSTQEQGYSQSQIPYFSSLLARVLTATFIAPEQNVLLHLYSHFSHFTVDHDLVC